MSLMPFALERFICCTKHKKLGEIILYRHLLPPNGACARGDSLNLSAWPPGTTGGNDGSFLGDPAGGFEMAWETLTNGTATLTD